MKINSFGLIIVSAIIVSMPGCSLEGKSCVYSDVKENNDYHCKDSNTSESCQTDGLWGQEETCPLGCDETSGRCIGSFNCDDCQLGCNPAGTACANCNANKCANGQLRLCKADKSGYEENAVDCPLGCNPEGTDCATCTNKCVNGTLSLCKADKSGYEENTTDCPLGCNPEGTACKQCDANKCENGSLKICKDDQSGYEAPVNCLTGCNTNGTDCDNFCTNDICKDGFIYRCTNNSIDTKGDKCPVLIGNITGSCADSNKCKQCDESEIQLRRFCVSPTEYYICKDGLWSEYSIQCTNNQICDNKTDTCTTQINDKCINNSAGTGQILTMLNGNLQAEECPGAVSCNANNTNCGECHNDTDTKCESNTFYICNHGEYQIDETACSLGLGCRSDETGKGVCIECTTKQCKDNSSNIGIQTPCTNGTYQSDSECKANGVSVSCKSETECGECKNGTTKCSGSTLQTCTAGKWVSSACPFSLNCLDETRCKTCPTGYKECSSDETTLRTCIGDSFSETICDFKCHVPENGTYNPRCVECIPDDTKCFYSSAAHVCSQQGKWEDRSCPAGCINNVCYQTCESGSKQCNGKFSLVCNDGKWKSTTCKSGCNTSTGECNSN